MEMLIVGIALFFFAAMLMSLLILWVKEEWKMIREFNWKKDWK